MAEREVAAPAAPKSPRTLPGGPLKKPPAPKDTDPVDLSTKPDVAATETVTTGSTAPARPPAPAWMTKGVEEPGKEATVPASKKEFIDAIAGIVQYGCGMLASRTGYDVWPNGKGNWEGYEGFRFSPDEEVHLQRALSFMLRKVDPTKYLDVVALGYLGIIVVSKGAGYLSWREEHPKPKKPVNPELNKGRGRGGGRDRPSGGGRRNNF